MSNEVKTPCKPPPDCRDMGNRLHSALKNVDTTPFKAPPHKGSPFDLTGRNGIQHPHGWDHGVKRKTHVPLDNFEPTSRIEPGACCMGDRSATKSSEASFCEWYLQSTNAQPVKPRAYLLDDA